MNTIILNQNGSISETLIDKNINLSLFNDSDLNKIKNVIKKRGMSTLQLLHTWEFSSNYYVLFGYKNGNAGMENKHELPKPLEYNLYFGDMVLCKFKSNNLIDYLYQTEFYNLFNHLFGGFYDLGESDSELSDPEDMWRYNSEEDLDYEPSNTPSSEDYESEYNSSD